MHCGGRAVLAQQSEVRRLVEANQNATAGAVGGLPRAFVLHHNRSLSGLCLRLILGETDRLSYHCRCQDYIILLRDGQHGPAGGMKKGDIIQISVGGRTSYATVNSVPDPRTLFISFDRALSFGGSYRFFTAVLSLDDHGRWREMETSVQVNVTDHAAH